MLVLSLGAHAALGWAMEQLPRRDPTPPTQLTVRLVPPPAAPPTAAPPTEPPPEPIKPPEPLPEPPPEPPVVTPEPVKPPPTPKPPRPRPTKPAARPADAAPSDRAVTVDTPKGPTTDVPVFGVTMESASGRGPAVPQGNTLDGPRGPSGPTRPLAAGAPVAAHEVSKMPLPIGRCAGKSTEEARAAGVEGVVVLDLVVGEDGKAREITVVQGLPHGLSEAAVAALKGCRFSPGERNGQPVPVRIRAFKVRFINDTDL